MRGVCYLKALRKDTAAELFRIHYGLLRLGDFKKLITQVFRVFLVILYGSIVHNGLRHAKTDFGTKIILHYGNAVKRSETINIIFDHFSSFSPHCLPLAYSCHIQQHVCCSPSQLFIFLLFLDSARAVHSMSRWWNSSLTPPPFW